MNASISRKIGIRPGLSPPRNYLPQSLARLGTGDLLRADAARPADQEPGDQAGSRAQQAGVSVLVCEMGARSRPCPAYRQAAGGPARRERGRGRLPEGAPRRGVAGAGAAGVGAAGGGLAGRLLGVTALRPRRRGPMADAEGLGPRLLPRLLDSGVEAGDWEVWERPGRVRPRGRTHAERAAWGSNGSHGRSPPAFFKSESCGSQWLPPEQSDHGGNQ